MAITKLVEAGLARRRADDKAAPTKALAQQLVGFESLLEAGERPGFPPRLVRWTPTTDGRAVAVVERVEAAEGPLVARADFP